MVFINLKKAYDSVPRSAEQCGKLRVPVLYKHGKKLVGDCMTRNSAD